MRKQLKTYKVTFWRGNPQLRNGGYEKTEIMRGIDEDHVWARAYKKTTCYGSYSPINVEEVKEEN